MHRRPMIPACLFAALSLAIFACPVAGHAHARSTTPPTGIHVTDTGTVHDASIMSLFVTNIGSLGFDLANGASGLEYPIGSTRTALFASGLWVGATVAGQTRVTVAEYSMEWTPGRIVGGAPEPDSPELRCYKVQTIHTPFMPDTSGWTSYRVHAAAQGAPLGIRRFDDTSTPAPGDSIDVTGPDLPGHAAVWSVYNDADPSTHSNNAGNTPPMGLEVRQTAYSTIGGPAVYVRWQIRNGGPAVIQNAYIGFWSDPDLGGAGDDLVGYDASQQMGFAYNATDADLIYGATPPAIGTMLLEGPYDPSAGVRRDAYAFTRYVNGTDPNSSTQSFNYMKGLNADGTPIIDPTTTQPTRFAVPGYPEFGIGWLDTNPADRRMMVSAGPITLAPGQSTDLVVAFVIGHGDDRLSSIRSLRCKADYALEQYSDGFPSVIEPDCASPTAVRCPAPASFFAGVCDNAASYPPGTLFALTNCADLRSTSFAVTDTVGWCNLLHATGTASQRAYREYLALLANSCSFYQGNTLTGPGGKLVGINDATPASVPPLTGSTVGELLLPAGAALPLSFTADYIDAVDPAAPDGLVPVDLGLAGFGGGAGAMSEAFGSTLDPAAMPDSFPRVQLTFDASEGSQLAHRYLRLHTPDGDIPINGREYRYGGRHPIPVIAHDAETGEQLELAFVEKAMTDDNGTLLPSGQQLATFDSTWSPSDELDGGREYLAVYRRGYTGAPRAEFAVNGAFVDGSLPGLYLLAARTEPGRTIDDGDGFFWEFSDPPTFPSSIDEYLIALAKQPQGDPEVIAAYDALATNLAAINSGATLAEGCDTAVPAVLHLIEVRADEGGVTLVWHTEGDASAFGLERRRGDGAWTPLALVSPDGTGSIVYVDGDVSPGERLSYRLIDPDSGQPWPASLATIDVPGATPGMLELAGVVPDGDGVRVRFTLPRAAQARLDVYDALGRRMGGEDLGRLDAGTYVRRVGGGALRSSGLYFVRLRVDGQERVTKALFSSN